MNDKKGATWNLVTLPGNETNSRSHRRGRRYASVDLASGRLQHTCIALPTETKRFTSGSPQTSIIFVGGSDSPSLLLCSKCHSTHGEESHFASSITFHTPLMAVRNVRRGSYCKPRVLQGTAESCRTQGQRDPGPVPSCHVDVVLCTNKNNTFREDPPGSAQELRGMPCCKSDRRYPTELGSGGGMSEPIG